MSDMSPIGDCHRESMYTGVKMNWKVSEDADCHQVGTKVCYDACISP